MSASTLSINNSAGGSAEIAPALMCNPPKCEYSAPLFGCTEQESNNDIVIDNKFGLLIDKLRQILNGRGLTSLEVDVGQIRKAMEDYQSDESEWGRFALADPLRGYTRNGIVNINGNANLLILVWSPGKGSAIHDHANAHCCMKVLKGTLTETLYDVPVEEGGPMVSKDESELLRNEVGYISDDIGLHRIANASSDDYAVTLHLYTPPYASLYGCSMYELGNLKKHRVDMSKYFSWQGKKLDQKNASTC